MSISGIAIRPIAAARARLEPDTAAKPALAHSLRVRGVEVPGVPDLRLKIDLYRRLARVTTEDGSEGYIDAAGAYVWEPTK